ncbi:hypothetical protein CF120_18480 [Aeromonas allosaccharophila]|nr:hypothetical protein CF120_18480 [Aeromonas allosaccharophila]
MTGSTPKQTDATSHRYPFIFFIFFARTGYIVRTKKPNPAFYRVRRILADFAMQLKYIMFTIKNEIFGCYKTLISR